MDLAKGEQVLSCTIITCDANRVIGELHNRMPVILDEADWPKWLGEEPATEDKLLAQLKAVVLTRCGTPVFLE
jgi:putative SOS response-associated peptidase YedK